VRKGNVFLDLGFAPEEAVALRMKAELHSQIIKMAKRYRQAELQKILGENQPRVSNLLTGKISKFSLETLIGYADALHLSPELKVHDPGPALRQFAAAQT
jgi:predicted XRE-type DNA-binding protein